MDSREREQRRNEGFNEKGEILYDAGERDERNDFRKEKTRKREEKDSSEYDPSDDAANESNPHDVNDQVDRKTQRSNEYGLDDEEFEDVEGLPEEEEEDIFEDDQEDRLR